MSKKDEFKEFVRNKPELANYVENGKMTWQKFYELFDLYGTDDNIWSKYNENRSNVNISEGINKITNMVKNVDMESIKNHINTAQKAIDLVQDFTTKKVSEDVSLNINKGPVTPRPINKFFED